MQTKNKILEILRTTGAIIENSHFVGTSGLHFDTYVNKDFLYPHTKDISNICAMIAEKFKDYGVEVVVGPALGGIILSQWTAHHLSGILGREILSVYTEKDIEKNQVFTRGYDAYVKGKKVLLVEDVITTGGSVLKSAESIKAAGGEVVSACALVNKNKDMKDDIKGVPFFALSEFFVETYESSKCPLCEKGVPMNTMVGHGKKFLENKK